jgi:hypothetical protein
VHLDLHQYTAPMSNNVRTSVALAMICHSSFHYTRRQRTSEVARIIAREQISPLPHFFGLFIRG